MSTVTIEFETYRALGTLQAQHDTMAARMYRAWIRNADRAEHGVFATDPELTYHLDTVEAIGDHLEAHDNG
jgi:hypothetical protein